MTKDRSCAGGARRGARDPVATASRAAACLCALALILGAGLAGPAAAQAVDTTGVKEASDPARKVDFSADSMTVDRDSKKIVLTGAVQAMRGDVELTSNELVIEYAESIQDAQFLNAKGNVVITTADQVIRSQWARMDVDANTVTMGDEVQVTQGDTLLSGKKLFMNLDSGRSEMTGGRVRGRFVPE